MNTVNLPYISSFDRFISLDNHSSHQQLVDITPRISGNAISTNDEFNNLKSQFSVLFEERKRHNRKLSFIAKSFNSLF